VEGVDVSGQVKHVVRVVADVAIEDEGVGASPLTPALARELAEEYGARAWLASIGELRWAIGRPMVTSATLLAPETIITESDTDDMCDMGEPASVPPAAQK
jgi:hypothetical protein